MATTVSSSGALERAGARRHDVQRYYTAEKGTLTVTLIGGGSKSAWIDSRTHIESLDGIVLSELVIVLLDRKRQS